MYTIQQHDRIISYCETFAALAPKGKWQKIENKGIAVLELLNNENSYQICARLSVAAFFLQKYDLAKKYASHCREVISIVQNMQKKKQLSLLAFPRENLSELADLIQVVFDACNEVEKK